MLVTVQDLKDFINITSSEHDLFLSVVSKEAQGEIEDWLGRKFDEATYTEDFSGDGSNLRILNKRPVTSINQVLTSIAATSEIPASGYEFFQEEGTLELTGAIFPLGIKNCRVIYKAGYTTATAPAALQLAVKQLATLIYNGSGRGEGRLGKASISNPNGGTVSFIHDLPAPTKRMLSRYRNLSF